MEVPAGLRAEIAMQGPAAEVRSDPSDSDRDPGSCQRTTRREISVAFAVQFNDGFRAGAATNNDFHSLAARCPDAKMNRAVA